MSEPQDNIADVANQLHQGEPAQQWDPFGGSLDTPGTDFPGATDVFHGDGIERIGDRDMEVLDEFNKSHPGRDNPAGDLAPTGIVGAGGWEPPAQDGTDQPTDGGYLDTSAGGSEVFE